MKQSLALCCLIVACGPPEKKQEQKTNDTQTQTDTTTPSNNQPVIDPPKTILMSVTPQSMLPGKQAVMLHNVQAFLNDPGAIMVPWRSSSPMGWQAFENGVVVEGGLCAGAQGSENFICVGLAAGIREAVKNALNDAIENGDMIRQQIASAFNALSSLYVAITVDGDNKLIDAYTFGEVSTMKCGEIYTPVEIVNGQLQISYYSAALRELESKIFPALLPESVPRTGNEVKLQSLLDKLTCDYSKCYGVDVALRTALLAQVDASMDVTVNIPTNAQVISPVCK